MTNEPRPPWLIRQENGSLAEARTRAFLMDRFWVLERSADVEGADLIIQRRLTSQSLLDRTPPRLGFVQTKFYTDTATTQFIHREYVLDTQGTPRAEFFTICHTGLEDDARAFFIGAEEIFARFRMTDDEHSKPNRFILPGKDVLIPRFEIVDRENVLDQIERTLREADFVKNRAFVAWAVPSIQREPTPILPLYEEQIDNWFCDIPSEFLRIKEKAKSVSWELEDVVSRVRELQESRDPVRVLEIADEIKRYWGTKVDLPDLYDPDFLKAAQNHKKRYEQLKKEGLLGAHAAMRRSVIDRFVTDVAPRMPVPNDQVYELTVRFNPATLRDFNLKSRFTKTTSVEAVKTRRPYELDLEEMENSSGILKHGLGLVRAFIAPSRYAYKTFVNGEFVDTLGPWERRITWVAEIVSATVMERVLLDRLG